MKYEPAFPVFGLDARAGQLFQAVNATGMTLRDYFAAQAMQGFISGTLADGSRFDPEDETILAKVAYKMADAMLEARK